MVTIVLGSFPRSAAAAAAAEDPRGIDLYTAASAGGGKDRLPPSGSIPSCGPCPCVGPPGVERTKHAQDLTMYGEDLGVRYRALRILNANTVRSGS